MAQPSKSKFHTCHLQHCRPLWIAHVAPLPYGLIVLGDDFNSTSIMELQLSALLGFSFGVLNIIFDAEYVLHVD